MLGKLIKYEMKTVARLLVPLHLLLLAVSVAGRFYISLFLNQPIFSDVNNGFAAALTATLTAFYILLLFAVTVITFVYLIILRPHRNLFSDEGYLMHTLPVTVWELIFSKMLVTILWFFIDGILLLASILILNTNEVFLQELSELLPMIFGEVCSFLNWPPLIFVLWFLVTLLLAFALKFSQILAAMAAGHSMTEHKILFSVLIYIGISMALSLLSGAIGIVTGLSPLNVAEADVYVRFGLILETVSSLILTIVFVLMSAHFMKKKLNLE